jgi:hypothetical protein
VCVRTENKIVQIPPQKNTCGIFSQPSFSLADIREKNPRTKKKINHFFIDYIDMNVIITKNLFNNVARSGTFKLSVVCQI